MLKFPEAFSGQDIALIVPQHLYNNKTFMKREVIAKFISLGIKDFASRLTVYGAFTGVDGKKPTKKQTQPYISEILEDLDLNGYKYVFIMDANYFAVMTGNAFEASIGKTVVAIDEKYKDITIAPLVNPLVVKQRAAKLPLYDRAMRVAGEVLHGTYKELAPFQFKIYEKITNIKDMENCLKSLMDNPRLAYDIETTGLHHLKSDIITYALAPSETEAYTFVVHEKYIGKANAEKARKLFANFLKEYKGTHIIHNVGFESKFLASKYVMNKYNDYKGLNDFLRNWQFDDTMLMAYALYNSTERVTLALKDLVKERYGDYDSDINVKDAINQDIDKLSYYNALDVSATFWLYNKLSKELTDSQMKFYQTEMKNAQVSFTKLMATGIMVDMPSVLEAESHLSHRLSELDRVFYQNFYVREATENVKDDLVVKYNESHKVKQVTAEFYDDIQFNPQSAIQLRSLLFETMGLYSTEKTKSGKPSTARSVIEDLLENSEDESINEVLTCLVGFSEISIILNTFIRALRDDSIEVEKDTYRLYPNYRVGGTLSFRPTSNNINLLNMPAQGPMGKLIKNCFKATSGKIIISSDYNALQGFTGANQTLDPALMAIYGNDIDYHAYMTVRYWPHEFEEGHAEDREYYEWVKENYEELRQKSKGISFLLQFGGGPNKLAKQLKVPYEEAKRLYDAYHGTYSQVGKFGEKVVKFAEANGYVEIGHHGLRLQTPLVTKAAKAKVNSLRRNLNEELHAQKVALNKGQTVPELSVSEEDVRIAEAVQGSSERTLINAKTQYYDLVTLQALDKFQKRIEEVGYDNQVVGHATIYDSLYAECDKDPEIVKWANENLIDCMTGTDYVPNQTLKLKANMDIGTSWSDLVELPNNASLEEIKQVLSELVV